MRRSLQFATVLLSLLFAATTVFAQRGDASASGSNAKGSAASGHNSGSSHSVGRELSTVPTKGYVNPFQQQIHLPGGGVGCHRCGYGVYGGYVYSGYEGNYYNGVGPTATDRILANGGTFNNINDTNSEQQQPAPQQQAPIYIRPEYPTNYATDNSTVNTPLQNNVASASSDSPALLIFKDGSKMTIRNYAIYGAYIVVLTPERRKFPIAALDVAATQKANEEAGYDLHLPAVFSSR